MKKIEKYIIIVLTIIAFVAIMSIIFLKKNYQKDPNELIAASYYENFAWGYSFSGIGIFADGSIYKWNVSDDDSKYISNYVNTSTYDGLKEFILKNAQKLNTIVSSADLNDLNYYVDLINADSTNFKMNNYGNDIGKYAIYVYHDNQPYLIYQDGDWTGVSKDSNAHKLIKIINKYSKEYK